VRPPLLGSRLAGVCALLALVVALSTTSYAAVSVARNSVGTPQLKKQAVTTAKLKKNAVTSSRIKDGSITAEDLRAGVLPTGPVVDELPSGETLRGYLAMFANADANFEVASDAVPFAFPLPADLAAPNVHRIDIGDIAPPQCPGEYTDPQAEPGNLCVYIDFTSNLATDNVNGPDGDDTASRFGFTYFLRSAGAGDYRIRATWAVTAP
jgi:hypothetical protein